MKIVSFNVNGIRSRLHALEALVQAHSPDIIGLQETKVPDADFPRAAVEALGYHPVVHGQKAHYGVALLSRQPPADIIRGLPGDGREAQRRLVGGRFPLADGRRLTVLNGYFPQGENRQHPLKFPAKQAFYAGLRAYLQSDFSPDEPLVVLGDFNVAPADADVGIGADNARRWLREGKCCFLPEERQWLRELCGWGLEDCWRRLHPQADDVYSWFDYRSKGFEREPRRGLRIDLLLATASAARHCTAAGIDYAVRAGERPSDHCPVWAEFDL